MYVTDLTRLVMYTAAGRLADRGFRMMRDILPCRGDCFDTTPGCDGQSDRQTDRQRDREMESSAYVRARRIALSADKTRCTPILARIYVYADATIIIVTDRAA